MIRLRFSLSAPADAANGAATPERVILVHGLARSSRSLGAIGLALRAAGYAVRHAAYPSTCAAPDVLERIAGNQVHLIACDTQHNQRLAYLGTRSI